MKTYTCNRCENLKSEPCVLIADKDSKPTHCPCTDSMKPYATWVEHPKNSLCDHEFGTDGAHQNIFCKKCFMDKPAKEYKVGALIINSDNKKCIVIDTKKGSI